MLLMMEFSRGENVTLPPLYGRRPSSTLVFCNKIPHLSTVSPLNTVIKFGPRKSVRRSCVSHLQLPLFSVQLLHLIQDAVEARIFVPSVGELGLKTYVSKPLNGIVHFFSKGVRLLIKGYFVGGVGANGLRLDNGDGV